MIGLVLMMKGMFLSRIIIGLLIGFAAISLAIIVAKFSFFKSKEDKTEVENDKQ